RVREVGGGAALTGGNRLGEARCVVPTPAAGGAARALEHGGHDGGDDGRRRPFVTREPDLVGGRCPEGDVALEGGARHRRGARGDVQGERVEEGVVARSEAGGGQFGGDGARPFVDAFGDRAQPVGAVVDGVGGGHDGEQHLGGADVRGRAVAPDVLFAGLQGEPVGPAAVCV